MLHRRNPIIASLFVLTALFVVASGCVPAGLGTTPSEEAGPGSLIIYSGRSESLVAPLLDQFRQESGIDVQVRYGSTAELAATLLEEGVHSPADVFYAQDPGGLGVISSAGMLAPLPDAVLDRVDDRFRAPDGDWIGVSGRARVVVYNTDNVRPADLPADIWDFTDPAWKDRIGWPPTNASFQTMVTGMRALWGEEKTRAWLQGLQDNHPIAYENNTATVAGVAAGEVDVGFVNHYYLYRFLEEEGTDYKARNAFLTGGGPGSLVMVSGAGVLTTAPHADNALAFLRFMLSSTAQTYFAEETFEYPLIDEVSIPAGLIPLDDLDVADIGLAGLSDLPGTARLLQDVGILP